MNTNKSSNVNLKKLEIVEKYEVSAISGWGENEIEDLARKNVYDIIKDEGGKYYISMNRFLVKCADEKSIKDIMKKINLNMAKKQKEL